MGNKESFSTSGDPESLQMKKGRRAFRKKHSVSTGTKMAEVVGGWEYKAGEKVEEKQPLPFKKMSRTYLHDTFTYISLVRT